MSKITISLEDKKLIIKKESSRQSKKNVEIVPIDLLQYEKEYVSSIRAANKQQKNKVLFIEKVEGIVSNENEDDEDISISGVNVDNVIVVYSDDDKIKYSYCSLEKVYKRLVKLKFKVLKIRLTKRTLKIKILAYVINKYNLNISHTKFYIDEKLGQDCSLRQYKKQLTKFEMLKDDNIYTYKFNTKDIIKDESTINGSIRYLLNIDGNEIEYKIAVKKKKQKNPQHYYAPMKSVFVKDFAIHIRRTIKGNLVLVKRLKEPIENTLKFKIMESKIVSNLLYGISKILVPRRKKK